MNKLTQLTHTIAQRIARYLERQGLLVSDAEHSYFTADAVDEGPMDQLLGSSITYRIAVGPQQGRKVFTLQTLPDCRSDNPLTPTVGKAAGFSLHAGRHQGPGTGQAGTLVPLHHQAGGIHQTPVAEMRKLQSAGCRSFPVRC